MSSSNKVPLNSDVPTTINMYGCGGCGTNIINTLRNRIKIDGGTIINAEGKEGKAIQYISVDTSDSVHNPDMDYPAHVITTARSGSGKIRQTNVTEINDYISSGKIFEGQSAPKDINIVVASLSGGSGSVISPLLIKALKKHDKAIVGCFVADVSSQVAADNTTKALQSYIKICEENDIYLPAMIFCNDQKESDVDNCITARVYFLIKMLFGKQERLDRFDKINYLSPSKFRKIVPGIYEFYIGAGDDIESIKILRDKGETWSEFDQTEVYDTVMLITRDKDNTVRARSRFQVKGVVEDESDTIVSYMGHRISDNFIQRLNDTLDLYDKYVKSSSVDLEIDAENSEINSTGLVL